MIEKERIAAYLFSLEKDMPDFLDGLERKAVEDNVPIIRKSTQGVLRFLMAAVQPEEILEVGTAVGFSGIYMMTYLEEYRKDAHLTTIEKVSYRIEEAKRNFKEAGFSEKITLLSGDAGDVLERLVEQGKKYDMIFMDAAKGQYLYFYPMVKALLRKGGLLVSDNVLQDGTIVESKYSIVRRDRTIHERMREYLYQLSHDEELETVTIPVGDGLTLSYKKV
jgi:predicted O-methyltransferase YrrM